MSCMLGISKDGDNFHGFVKNVLVKERFDEWKVVWSEAEKGGGGSVGRERGM